MNLQSGRKISRGRKILWRFAPSCDIRRCRSFQTSGCECQRLKMLLAQPRGSLRESYFRELNKLPAVLCFSYDKPIIMTAKC